MEVLVEDQVAAPGGVALETVDPRAGPPPVRPDDEQVDQPPAQVGGDPVEGAPGAARRVLDGELVAEEPVVALEGADQQVVEREPDGPAPVGVPPNIPVVDSAGS